MAHTRIAFIDLETTGTRPNEDRITEIGVILVEGAHQTEWSSLVNPERPIPPPIQSLTGISNAMVAQAPRFAELAPILGKLLQGALFVAHNARFDHGFLENEYGRLNQDFQPDRLCTVKLSRRLYPHFRHHNLDSLIERHQLYVAARHRALDDAKVLVNFWETLQREFAPDTFDAQVLATIERRHWPVWLPPDLPQQLPDAPGVYEMLNDRGASLYVSRALRLKSQVIAHFQPSVRASAKSQRLAAQTRHILWHETGGELGARLLEQHWVAERQPSLNRRPRRKAFESSPWPFDGPRIIREGHWMHLIHDWDYLGSARNPDDYARLLAEASPRFNPEVHTLLRDQLGVLQTYERGALPVLSPGRSQDKKHPPGGQQAEGTAGGPVLSPGRPQDKKRPPGGQQAEGAAWGPVLSPGRPQDKKRPPGGQQAEGAAWGPFLL